MSFQFYWSKFPSNHVTKWFYHITVYHHLFKVTSAKKCNFMVFNVQLKNFISWKSYALFLRYSMFGISNDSINCKVCGAMTSISTLKRAGFITSLAYHKSLGHETGPTRKYFEWLGGLGSSSRSFSICQLVKHFLNNQVW